MELSELMTTYKIRVWPCFFCHGGYYKYMYLINYQKGLKGVLIIKT